ncbi:MAG: HAD family hydrolase, partial [Aquihabitans sp.]
GTLVDYEPDRTQLEYPETLRLVQLWGGSVDHELFLAQWDASSADLEQVSANTFEEFTMLDAAGAFAATAGLVLSQDQVTELAATFIAEWERHVTPVVGVTNLITSLAGTYRLGIVSNTHDPHMVTSMLQKMGVDNHVEMIVLSVDHGHCKPHPSIYERAIERMGCAPSSIAFVGDSYESDYLGPRREGMEAYLIDPQALHRLPATARLQSVLDLAALLLPV